jgi:hypothetical protein
MIISVEDKPLNERSVAVDIAQAIEHLEHALTIIHAWQAEQIEQRSARNRRAIINRENRRGHA